MNLLRELSNLVNAIFSVRKPHSSTRHTSERRNTYSPSRSNDTHSPSQVQQDIPISAPEEHLVWKNLNQGRSPTEGLNIVEEDRDIWKPFEQNGLDAINIQAASLFEQTVADYLRELTAPFGGKVFTNMIVPFGEERTAEVDCVVLLEDGLVVVECKNYGGTIYCNFDEKKNWVQYMGNGKSYPFYSPVAQNATHMRALCYACGLEPSRCVSLIVFSDKAVLKGIPPDTGNTVVMRYDELPTLDVSPREDQLLEPQRYQFVKAMLERFSSASPEVRYAHKKYAQAVKQKASDTYKADRVCKDPKPIQSEGMLLCPYCRERLIRRHSRTGHEFLGCSAYPACHYTHDLIG